MKITVEQRNQTAWDVSLDDVIVGQFIARDGAVFYETDSEYQYSAEALAKVVISRALLAERLEGMNQ